MLAPLPNARQFSTGTISCKRDQERRICLWEYDHVDDWAALNVSIALTATEKQTERLPGGLRLLCDGLLHLYEATCDVRWLQEAQVFSQPCYPFLDEENGSSIPPATTTNN